MKTKHTPGPWIYDGKSRDVIRNENGTLVAQLYKIHEDSLGADARLIAAAPELLEASQLLISEIYNKAAFRHLMDVSEVTALLNAIAKATGEGANDVDSLLKTGHWGRNTNE